MKYCPHCGKPVRENAKFCPSCGETLTVSQDQPATNTNQIKGIYDSATAKLNQYTGEKGAVKVNISDLFSEVFKHHSKKEADAIFIAGTESTTPALADVSDEWAKPWLFSRILIGFLLAFVVLLYMAVSFHNDKAVPGLILVGAFAVPFSGLVFFFRKLQEQVSHTKQPQDIPISRWCLGQALSRAGGDGEAFGRCVV
ncbi:zinc-ribbon domain-containing protein, partial [Levilactobacillus brevis]|uniref:zinc-ribbon domain-containing protein n=1 Tax=Levilactobacillus brevis TaxID=1580 RepID=UPI00117A10FF